MIIRHAYFEIALCKISMSQLQAVARSFKAWDVDCRAAFEYLALLKLWDLYDYTYGHHVLIIDKIR